MALRVRRTRALRSGDDGRGGAAPPLQSAAADERVGRVRGECVSEDDRRVAAEVGGRPVVERLDERGVLDGDDGALDLHRRRQLAARDADRRDRGAALHALRARHGERLAGDRPSRGARGTRERGGGTL